MEKCIFWPESDKREPSHEELEYERQQELNTLLKHAEQEQKTIPLRCMDDVVFKNLLGLGHIVKSE